MKSNLINNELVCLGKIPPQAIQLEEAIIGAILSNPTKIDKAFINPKYCYNNNNVLILTAIEKLQKDNLPIDILTVSEQLKKDGFYEQIGGSLYLIELQSKCSSASHIEFHNVILEQKYIQREIITECYDIQRLCYEDQEDINDIIDKLNKLKNNIDNILEHHIIERNIEVQTNDLLNNIDNRIERYNNNLPEGISSGFKSLDKYIRGFKKSELIILAARPSVGKTALALSFTKNIIDADNKVLFISIEMKDTSLIDRLILSYTELNPERYYSGNINDIEMELICKNTEIINEKKLIIKDDIKTTDKIKHSIKIYNPDIVFIDYLGLIKSDESNKNINRNQQLGQITKELKRMCKQFDIPIVLLCQLNREVEKRGNKEPTLSDLRDSGEIEEDADIVILLHRADKYDETLLSGGKFIIAKNRNGAIGYSEFDYNDKSLTVCYDKDYKKEIEYRELTF